jgi:class 3 adenylate cyclase/predicted ATPase
VSFIATVEQARALLERHGRLSLRALQREFDLGDEVLEDLVAELVDVLQVAAREGKILSWIGSAPTEASVPEPETRAIREASSAPAATRQPAEAERRQLTVMFCDLAGSTDLSQRLDAEDLRDVVRAYQESASTVIQRYEGHIAQYLGDGLLVYFGYPRAHEEDAERAVRAGLEILTALGTLNVTLEPEHGIRLAARVGIHTGLVVVGQMGGGVKSETLALGATTNVAARLESVAEPDSVVISGATLRLVPGLFATEDLGTPALKGIAEPIRAHAVLRATGVRSRLDVDPSKLTPLVGRDQEVGLLLELWEQAQEGEGQTVLISGEAGLGKSRLLQAFRERLAEMPHGWLECGCSPYTQRSAFYPVVELVEQGLGFKEGDDPETKLSRLETGVEVGRLPAPDVVPLIAALLPLELPDRYSALGLSPELQRKKTIEALVAWIVGLAESQPLVMLVEDLHWCDASTVELLGWLLEQSPTANVLTLLSFRPDFEPPWSARSHLTPLAVKRLSHRQATNLIGGMTRDVPLPAAVVERVVERADGVPLFVEELTKMVLESDLVEERGGRYELTGSITGLAIPATLQDSLMARLDRLGKGKEVAQLGAALGREFSYELLRSVSLQQDPALHEGLAQLVGAELLYCRGTPPRATYTFKHAMIQDTAYRSLLKSVRQKFHARIALVLEERFPERIESEPEVIARHCDEAGLAAQAIAHYQRAGERATQRSANEEVIGHLRRALVLLATLPETLERNQHELRLQMAIGAPLAAVRGWAGAECEAAFERARQLASRVGELHDLPRTLVALAVSYYVKGDLTASAELAEQALEAAQRSGDAYDLLSAHSAAGSALFFRGEFSAAIRHCQQVIELYDPTEHAALVLEVGIDRSVIARNFAAATHWLLGHPDRAAETTRQALALARRLEHPLSLALAISWAGIVHHLRREPSLTRELAEQAIALADEHGFPLYRGMGRALLGWAQPDPGEGVAEIRQGLAELAGTGTGIGAPLFLGLLAQGAWRAGRRDDALVALELSVSSAQEKGQHFYDAERLRLQAGILLDNDGGAGDEAETLLRRALEIAQGQEAKSLELRAATSLARLWQRRGRCDEARDLLEPVYAWFTEGFDTQDLKDAKALLLELS